MSIVRGFHGFEAGDNSTNQSFSASDIGVLADGTARTGRVYLKQFNLTSTTGGRIQFASNGLVGTSLAVGEQAIGLLRVALRIRAYPSANNVCAIGFGRRGDGSSVSSSIAFDTSGHIAARATNNFSSYGSVVMPLDTWLLVTVEQLLTRTASPLTDSCKTTVTVTTEDGTLLDTATVTLVGVLHGVGINAPECGGDGFVSSTRSWDFDDAVWYLADKGDVAGAALPAANRITGVFPRGQGASNDFTGSWQNVADWPRETLFATEVDATTNGHTTTYTHRTAASLGLGNIAAVRVIGNARAASSGTEALMWNGAEGAYSLFTTYSGGSNTGAMYDWTALSHAAFNAAEFGFRNKRGVQTWLGNVMAEVLHDAATDTRDPELDGGTASWKHACGTYTGNGDFQKIPLDFRPAFIMVKKATGAGSNMGSVWLGVFGGTQTKRQNATMGNLSASIGGVFASIMFVEDDGFTVGPDDTANRSGDPYEYIAIRDGGEASEGFYFTQGVFLGNGVDNTDVAMLKPFQPEVVITFGLNVPVYRDSAFVGDASMQLLSSATTTNQIQALNADGFQVGTSALVNTLRTPCPYIAIRRGALAKLDGFFAFGNFTAGAGTHTVTGMLFQPHFVMGDRPNTGDAAWRAADIAAHTGNVSNNWGTSATTTTAFTSITADGFTVGSQLAVSGQTCYWLALLQAGEVILVTPEIEFSEGGQVDIGLTWVEVTDKLDTLRVHSKIALPDPATYYGGFKDDRVIQWGRMTRALSDRLGQYESAQFTWLQADTDRLYRGIADNEFTKVLKNRPATLRMIDDPSRRLQLTPRTMMKGLIREYKPVAPLQWQWTMRDILAAKFSAENTTDQLPARLITRADFPDCPTDAINLPVPVIYGFVADAASTTDPPVLTGDPNLGAFNNEGYWGTGFGPLTSDADTPAGVATALASGGTLSVDVPNGEYGVIVTAVDASGRESDPQPYYYDGPGIGRGSFAAGPVSPDQVETPDGTQKITVSWSAAAGAVSYRVYLGWYYYGFRPTQFIETASTSCEFTANPPWGEPVTTSNITPGANLINFGQFWYYAVSAEMPDGETALSPTVFGITRGYRRPLRVQWLEVTGALSYRVYRRGAAGTWDRVWTVPASQLYFDDDLLDTGATFIDGAPSPTGQVPVIPVGTRADSSGIPWFAFLVAGHAVKEITDVFQNGVRVDPGSFGVTWAVPGKSGYSTYFPATGTTQYLDINGNRYTLLFVRGPDGNDAADGTRPITVNVKGIEDVGDSSGALITDGLAQYKHAVINWVLQTWVSGDWLEAPVFADDPDLAQVDEDSFDAASLIAQQRLAGGYVGAWVLGAKGERISIRDLVARLNLSFDVDSGFNHKTQFFVTMVDDSLATLQAAGAIIDVRDIYAESFNVEPVDSEQFNRIPYSYNRDYTGQRPSGWNATSELSDATSIADLEETKSSPDIELWCVRSSGQAQDVIFRRLLRSKEPPLRVTWEMGMAGLAVELGDVKLLTHFGGLGSAGYVGRPVRILRHETDPEQFIVALEAFDMERLFSGTFILGDTAALPAAWTSATTVQQRYGYLCDASTGLFSDGKRGKRLR